MFLHRAHYGRIVKFPAIGRGNFLFVGNERAGRNAANFYSLVTSANARRNSATASRRRPSLCSISARATGSR